MGLSSISEYIDKGWCLCILWLNLFVLLFNPLQSNYRYCSPSDAGQKESHSGKKKKKSPTFSISLEEQQFNKNSIFNMILFQKWQVLKFFILSQPDIIFVTSSTSSASVKYFWIWVKLYRVNTLTTLLEGKCVKMITQDVLNCKENYTRS